MAYITVDVYSTSKGANGKKETCQKNREEWDTTSIMHDTTSTKGKKKYEEKEEQGGMGQRKDETQEPTAHQMQVQKEL